jgi:peptide/nickel transport system permease protein
MPEMLRVARRQPLGTLGALVVVVLLLTALGAPWLAPHGPKEVGFAAFVPPSPEFPMGTDHLGRDILSRVIWGARLSLWVGLASVVVGITLGALWGLVAAYFGGAPDLASQRVVDSLMALPPIVLALGLMAALGQSVNNVILALTILLMPTAARTVRAVALGVQVSPYIEAAQAVGCSHGRIIVRHILPNCLATYIVLVTTNVSYAIVVEAALSFLGAGAPPDEPSWGGMLTAGTQVMERAPWMMLFPGLAISLAVLALNLLGDAIRDVADPRLRGGLG